MIYQSLTDLIGNTPLLEVSGFEGQKARLVLKIEAFNPGGSVKDRIALQMIRDAEKAGVLKEGATIITHMVAAMLSMDSITRSIVPRRRGIALT